MLNVINTITVVVIVAAPVLGQDYYWRPYNGLIPEDAIVGTDDGQVKTYIGNVYVHNVGLLVGQIFGGSREITVTGGIENLGEVYKRYNNIKILCTDHPQKFEWISVNRTTLTNLDEDFVVGGQQAQHEGHLFIGRINYENALLVGKVDGYFTETVDIYFVYNGREVSTITYYYHFYEVLVYNADIKGELKQRLVSLRKI